MDSRLTKPPQVLPKPMLLKDYLLDGLSSCSSSGFQSFPRRQCSTTTVRFLIEIDLKNNHHQQKKKNNKYLDVNKPSPPCLLKKNPSKSALAAFHTIIMAMKRFPFGATVENSPEKKMVKKLPSFRRSLSLSKKMIEKSSFWKRKSNRKGIEQWKSFGQLLKEDSFEPSAISNSSTTTTEFAAPTESQNSNFYSQVELHLPCADNDVVEIATNDDVYAESTTSIKDASASTETKEKDHYSPASVLDCPFEDDEEEQQVFSPFQLRLEHIKESDDEDLFPKSSMSSVSETEHEEENGAAEKALELFNQMKDNIASLGLKVKVDKLLLEFFMEQMVIRKRKGYSFEENNVFKEVGSWINGTMSRNRLFLEWDVPSHREVYVKEMERQREWKSLDVENEEVVLEVEGEVLATLLNELW